MLKMLKEILRNRALIIEECRILRDFFNDDEVPNITPLINYLKKVGRFKKNSSRDYTSPASRIHAGDDIYGYAVTIENTRFGNAELLDCNPQAYRLTRGQANELYKAILSCVPTSIYYVDKVNAEQAELKNAHR